MISSHLSILSLTLLLSLSVSVSVAVAERCHPNDRKALLQIKKELNNPDFLSSWEPNTDCCDWWTVDCDINTNRITKFTLNKVGFHLPIPPAIGDLSHLQVIWFLVTNFTGQIPATISKLSHLSNLVLTQNLLTGPIPSFLGSLKKLTYIGLSSNRLTGSIPASLSQLPELNTLMLDENRLTGSIPESFGHFKVKDFYLYLSYNKLSGPIPRSLGYTNFTYLDVSRNKLEGDISFLFGKNKSIKYAYFSRNLFHFDFSRVEISENLTDLDLNHNKIFGSLPCKNMEQITSLNVSYNRLCGEIPVTGRLQEMDYTAFFHNKCLCGNPLPECK